MPKLLKFFFFLVATSLPLFFIWFNWGQSAYQDLIAGVIVPLAKPLGQRQLNMFYAKSHYMNIVPFVTLMLAVPALGWKKRVWGILIGFGLLFIWHLVFSLTLNHFQLLWGADRRFYRFYIPAVSLNSTLPVLVWCGLAWSGVKELLKEIFVRQNGEHL